jgi:hypothetical protein
MNLRFTSFRLLLLSTLLIFLYACEDKTLNDIPETSTSNESYEDREAKRIAFGKTFAKALENVELRNLIKNEAVKEFDKDTEVLFQLIKDSKLSSGISVFEYLVSIHKGDISLDRIVSDLPILTISVPHLARFSATTWDVDNQIPSVVVVPNKGPDGKKSELLPSFDYKGEEKVLSRKVFPGEPVLVIKDSERVVAKSGKNARLMGNESFAFENDKFLFAFWDESFDNSKAKKDSAAARWFYYSTFDPKLRFAKDNNLQYQRDYVYYNIAPELGVNTGTFQSDYAEFLTSMKFASTGAASTVYDDPSTDWSDGNFEFSFYAYFVDDKTKLGSVQKGFNVPFNDLFQWEEGPNGSIVVTGLKECMFPGSGHMIASWDMQKYGDTWKLTFYEQDQQTNQTIQVNTSVTSSFGTNYSNGQKDGANFGSTSSNGTTYAVNYSLSITGGPDQLYDALIVWKDKVLLTKDVIPLIGTWGRSYEASTGTLIVSIEPRYKY